MRTKFLLLPLSLALALCSTTFATVQGINDSPLGSRSSSDVQYAVWDNWGSFVMGAGSIAGTATLESTLSQSISAAPPYGPQAPSNDLFYTSSRATTWNLTAEADINMTTAVLQIKLTTPATTFTASTFYTPLLNGIAATPVLTQTGLTNEGFTFSVVQWTWENLNIAAGDSFTVAFSSPAGQYHTAIDTVSLDVSTIPEPSTWALLGLGAVGFFLFARRARRIV